MGIGAISGAGSAAYANFGNYRINSIYGNPRSLNPVEKIGKEQYGAKAFMSVTKPVDNQDTEAPKTEMPKEFNYDAAMSRMMIGSRYNAENIPMVTEA